MYDPRSHHADLLDRVKGLLARYLHRYWYRAVQGAGQLGDLFVTIEEISAELEVGYLSPPLDLPSPERLQARIDEARASEAARRAASPAIPAARLARDVGLDEPELELLLVMAALQTSPGLLRASTFAWADFSQKQPNAAFAVELLADDAEHRARLEHALTPDRPLRRLHLLRLGNDRRWQPGAPVLQRPLYVPDSVCRFLEGQPVVGEGYPPGAAWLESEGPAPDALVLPDAARLGTLLGNAARRTDRNAILLIGEPGSGRRTVARAHALGAGRPLFVIDLAVLPWELEPFEEQLAAALRDGLLAGALTLVRCDALDDRADRRPALLGRLVRDFGLPVVLAARADAVPLLTRVLPDAHSAPLADGPPEVRARLYRRLMDQHRFVSDPRQLIHLVETYKLRPGDLDRALRDVRITAPTAPQLDVGALDLAVRRQIRTHLSALATPSRTTQRWDDLVVDDELRLSIEEILLHARHRDRVFREWGFSRKLGGRGRGLSCLFSGPPGTGKTMTAGLIANELGLDLYQVDLSRIVDKYVGETEKNLARLFDEASRVPVVLLFDEADSLFATRTKVESSNDRYANLEVNFLLQRMESYDGISILTTNLATGIDQAFKRRLRFRLHFDLPGAEEREVLWKSMVPPGCALADDVDFGQLARKWEMSGAIIRNAMLRAAFLAAASGGSMTQAMLTRAARAELMEMGRLG